MKECPRDNYSPWMASLNPISGVAGDAMFGDAKEKMRPYCVEDLTEEMFGSMSVSQLVSRNYCPSYWVSSGPLMGELLVFMSLTSNQLWRTVCL